MSSVCWVGVRIGLCSGREAGGQADATWCWGVPGARAVNDRLSWRWLIRIAEQIKAIITAEIRVRPRSDLKAGCRLVEKGVTYLIEAALPDNDLSMLRLLCSNVPNP